VGTNGKEAKRLCPVTGKWRMNCVEPRLEDFCIVD